MCWHADVASMCWNTSGQGQATYGPYNCRRITNICACMYHGTTAVRLPSPASPQAACICTYMYNICVFVRLSLDPTLMSISFSLAACCCCSAAICAREVLRSSCAWDRQALSRWTLSCKQRGLTGSFIRNAQSYGHVLLASLDSVLCMCTVRAPPPRGHTHDTITAAQ